jgi:hypothetical protein
MRWLSVLLAVLVALMLAAPACENQRQAEPMPTPTVRVRATTTPKDTKVPVPPQRDNCSPCYPDVCLKVGVGDYDCAGGSGNGPNYIGGPVRVVGCDPFGLDRDGDGWGCQ